ncbi:MAG: hypothetical protein IJ510_02785 [Selenomonadales bacterium]|nr:hypothetical protein [Selenomonadales bacterium]
MPDKEERAISDLLQHLAQTEDVILADCMRRMTSPCELEQALAAILAEESRQYLAAIEAWNNKKECSVQIARLEAQWQALLARVDMGESLWHAQNLLWQMEASLICSMQFCEQAKKSFPYCEEQLFLEGYLHEKKKSRRKVEEVLRFVQNRIWEQTGFAPYCY